VLDRTTLLVVVGVTAFVVPLVFLALAAVVAIRQRRGVAGPRDANALSLVGGLAIGALLLADTGFTTEVPILAFGAFLAWQRWRAGRRRQAGLLMAGAALPWTLLWGLYLVARLLGLETFDLASTVQGFIVGAVPFAIGLALAARGDPPPPPLDIAAPVGQPGSRAIGSIALAVRGPGVIGPVGMPELAALVAFVASFLVVPLVVGLVVADRTISQLVSIVSVAAVASVLGTEAYVRGMPTRSRRAFEAFSWLGEWEIRRFRSVTGSRVPRTPGDAERWLAQHPEPPSEGTEPAAYRVEVLLLAGHFDDARRVAQAMPANDPVEAFMRASSLDVVDWRSGGDGDLPTLERLATEIVPSSGDDRLRAEVSIATARVRRRMADGRTEPGDAADPLIEVRERLGSRADGQVGRALRPRLIPVTFVATLVIGGLIAFLGTG
jgi:hypothetical protein